MDVLNLCEFFLAIEKEMSEIFSESDSFRKDGYYDKYKELEQTRYQKINQLFVGNNVDEMFDEVHDAVLCYDDGLVAMPNGYSATIIVSYRCTIMRHYKTIAIVNTPNNTEYLINVPTFDKLTIGTKI